jgi:hypothetical protein
VRQLAIHKHETAENLSHLLRENVWGSRFSVERHPHDRILSLWQYHTRKREKPPSLTQFLDTVVQAQGTEKWKLYLNGSIHSIGEHIVADRILRWESLAQDLPSFLETFGIHDLRLSTVKATFRSPGGAVDSLNQERRQRIQLLYDRELSLFRYER